MKKGKDISAKFGDLFIVHQNMPGKKTSSLSYDQHLLFIPLQGEITIKIENRILAFGLGHMLYLSPNTEHNFSSSEKFGERLIVMANWKLMPIAASGTVLKLPLNQLLKEILFYLLLHPKTKNAKALESVLGETLSELLIESTPLESNDHMEGKISDIRVKNAFAYMQANLESIASMNAVATRVGLSGRNFNRLILKETGLQPKQWLIRFRVEKAKELLKIPGATVTDVAFSVGYNSLGQFIAVFRARTGQLPSEYLKHG